MMLVGLVTLLLAPWHGPSVPTAAPNAAKYKLVVRGAPAQQVRLHTASLPHGWIASFCTPAFCSPFAYTVRLNARGSAVIEFQALRTQDSAPRHTRITVFASDAAPLDIRV